MNIIKMIGFTDCYRLFHEVIPVVGIFHLVH